MVPGTHVLFDDQALTMAVAAPDLARGDCLLMDYRLLHQGTANRSSKARPILFLGYTRPWFHDRENFKRQPRLIIGPQARAQIPAAYRRLFLEPGKAGLREDEP